ncbi:MAG TPA: protein kinase [Gaiellaceae bacterium]|nr:protein kinase [Gaiellaceae bacterium]
MKVGEVIADRYELEELVGEGGMSSVYRAHDRVLERRVAIKVLHLHYSGDPEYVERFRREARAIARLSHPNVVTVIDRGVWDDRQFIVFEHVEGETLKAVIEREGPLPVARALELAHEIARALASAHSLGIVHRDVKPHNVLLNATGTAKVTDFGIARSLDPEDELTATGTVLGTGHYLSPEQASGGRADERSDQYSLGVVLYELLTGEVPYTGETLMAVAVRHVRDPVPSVRARRPDVPPAVDALVARALAKSPQDRFADMESLCAELERCLAGLPGRRRDGGPAPADGDTSDLSLASAGSAPAAPRPPEPSQPRLRLVPSPAGPAPPPAPPRRRPRRLRLVGLALLAAVVVAGNLVALQLVLDDGLPFVGASGGRETRITVRAVEDYDPFGDRTEHPESVELATDGDRSTFWTTETYRSFTKQGVGILVDAGSPREVSRFRVFSDSPGFTVEILGGEQPDGPFESVSASRRAGERTELPVDSDGRALRWYVVWITALDGTAHVNEVLGFVRQ